MSDARKLTRERMEQLIKSTRQELVAFQLGRHITEPIFGVVDVPLFGLRFKFIATAVQDDGEYNVTYIVKSEDINSESIFLLLAANGYLRWLRQQLSTNVYLKILARRERWKLILDKALEKAVENKRGLYLQYLIRDMQEKPILQIYHEDPEVFDWILR